MFWDVTQTHMPQAAGLRPIFLQAPSMRQGESEQELRDKASLPGVPLEYLRFIREPTALAAGSDDATSEGDSPEASACGSGPWRRRIVSTRWDFTTPSGN